MTSQEAYRWAQMKTTVLGSELALIGGVLVTIFGFAMVAQSALALVLGTVASMIVFAAGVLLMRAGAGSRASAGFLALAITALALVVAYGSVDSMSTVTGAWLVLDVLLVIVGNGSAFIGGVLLSTSLGPLTGGLRLGKAAGYAFLAAGILQVASAFPDLIDLATNSMALDNLNTALYGVGGIVFAVVAPALLYLAVRKLSRSKVGVEKTKAPRPLVS